MKHICFFTCLLFALLPRTAAQENTTATFTGKLENISRRGALAGFAVAIVTPDSILYQRAFGFADIAAHQPYTINTLQPIASVSKTVVGVAITKAIELGLFTLETPVNDILPFNVINPNYPGEIIRVKHLVSHTSGITDRPAAVKSGYIFCSNRGNETGLAAGLLKAGYGNGDEQATLSSYLTDYFQPTGKLYNSRNFLKAKPGEVYEYSNIATALAAWLIEVKSGMSFPAFTSKYIFTPLQMDHTSWLSNCDSSASMAHLYNANMMAYPRYRSASYPDGGLVTSCRELTIYLQEMIKGYKGKDGILQKASYELLYKPMFTPGTTPRNMEPKEPNIGVMWIHRVNGIIGHTGSDGGVSAFMFFKPEMQLGLILISNSEIESTGQANKKQLADFSEVWKEMADFGKQLLQ
ncbi:serine hydrolase [Chitinophaga ginsengisegetis]|uniref:serine hydrolase domain-containing protein n=1 Tax=Chitinophaga ginsengisegetis TaxID=393003 RepID=UPI000DB9ED34|nr:serine hydrolase [Chitinophaga ginsengisegetis]MDR6570838.1 CubicO group peptidase (beta-lactamase class C family) [Chitinophaga ginsengisegetis]MDR6650572.1 CubicO group peptidase (beta-lactamase class C family) [Chitinophaga ginsengisegetis]MDR6656789.1 CubicO group peptidase (beta-lactamase class C family) [Chitinophaga ginsengisegetis]